MWTGTGRTGGAGWCCARLWKLKGWDENDKKAQKKKDYPHRCEQQQSEWTAELFGVTGNAGPVSDRIGLGPSCCCSVQGWWMDGDQDAHHKLRPSLVPARDAEPCKCAGPAVLCLEPSRPDRDGAT